MLASRFGAVMVAVLVWPAIGAAQTRIDSVAWMQGCWQLTDGDRVVEEHWTSPKAGIMLASGRTVQAGKLAGHEFVLLAERDGRLAYEAHPSDQPPTTFMSKELDAASVVFEDPTHDFPQRVGYRRVGPDRMMAWIEGSLSGKPRRIDFAFQRIDCPR